MADSWSCNGPDTDSPYMVYSSNRCSSIIASGPSFANDHEWRNQDFDRQKLTH